MVDEKQVAHLMKALDCTREEALQVIEDDKTIDKGKDLFPLSKEQKKVAKEMCRVDSDKQMNKGSGTTKKKAKKVDDNKNLLVETIVNAVTPIVEDFKVVNEGREYTMTLNGTKYKVVISAPRS